MSEILFDEATHPKTDRKPVDPHELLTDFLDPTDVEDLVLLFVQSEGWLLLPSTRMNDTPIYEAALCREDGRIAVVAVKSGKTNKVPVAEIAAAVPEAEVFVYSTDDAYAQPPKEFGATEIQPEQLIEFMAKHPNLLPPRIRRWLET